MEFKLPNTDILEHFAIPIGIWNTSNQKFEFANSAARRLFKSLHLETIDDISVYDFIADIDYSTFQTNSEEYLRVLNMSATGDEFPIPTEGFIKLRRDDLTEFVSYIYIHDITDELNVVRYRLIEIHTGYDELAENAEWENYFAIREKQAVAAFAGDIASQLNNALARIPGMLNKSGVLNLADNGQSLNALVDIAENLTNIANNALNMRSVSLIDQGEENTVVDKHLISTQRRNRVLVVDDDLPLLEILSYSLTQRFKTVLTATSIAEAMAVAESHDLDAVLIDLKLGNENGRELATKLKTLDSDLHIVYMTGYATSIPRIRRHENYDILRKPFTLEDALIAIEKSVD